MQQNDFFPIPSPCIGVCRSNNKGYCVGCLRSREERLYWQQMSDGQKHSVMQLLAERRKKIRRAAWEKRQPADEMQAEQQGLDFGMPE